MAAASVCTLIFLSALHTVLSWTSQRTAEWQRGALTVFECELFNDWAALEMLVYSSSSRFNFLSGVDFVQGKQLHALLSAVPGRGLLAPKQQSLSNVESDLQKGA